MFTRNNLLGYLRILVKITKSLTRKKIDTVFSKTRNTLMSSVLKCFLTVKYYDVMPKYIF